MSFDLILTIIFIILPIIFALICLYYAFSYFKSARLMLDTPPSKIRSAAQGFLELQGESKPFSPVTLAKLTKEPCAWYHYKIEERFVTETDGQTQTIYSPIEQGISSEPFILKDTTGECIIFPFAAEIMPTRQEVWYGSTLDFTKPPRTFLACLFATNTGRYRFTEQRVDLNTPLYATGMYRTVHQNDIRIQNTPSLQRYVLQNNLDEIHLLSTEELPKNHSFVISSLSRKTLIRRHRLKAALFLLAFIFFSSVTANSTYQMIVQILKENNNK